MLNKDSFGKQKIDKVKLSDAKQWLIKLQKVDGKGYSCVGIDVGHSFCDLQFQITIYNRKVTHTRLHTKRHVTDAHAWDLTGWRYGSNNGHSVIVSTTKNGTLGAVFR